MNELARLWLAEEADGRMHGTVKDRRRALPGIRYLGPLPVLRYDTRPTGNKARPLGRLSSKGNRYSVPGSLCGKTVMIRITLDGDLFIYGNDTLMAHHRLCPQQRDGLLMIPTTANSGEIRSRSRDEIYPSTRR